jgi:hypothetical protein
MERFPHPLLPLTMLVAYSDQCCCINYRCAIPCDDEVPTMCVIFGLTLMDGRKK